MGGSPRFLAVYKMESPDVINSDAYRNHAMSEWDRRMKSLYDLRVRGAYRDITKPLGPG